MSSYCARRIAVTAVLGVVIPRMLFADVTPTWSARFAGAGFTYSVFERGPVCSQTHQAAGGGSRLYVGGEYTAIGGVAYRSLASYDGQIWSRVQGFVSEFGAESVAMITEMPIDGARRVVVGGFFDAPQTSDGLGYIDGEETIRSFPPGPRSPHTWIGSVFAWESPTGPELVLGSGLFPEGSDYIYRYTSKGYGLMSPGVITITTAYAVFDDGSGPALYIGVPRVGAAFSQSISRWDGSVLATHQVGMSWVNALCVHDDGDGPALYAAGVGLRRYRGGVWETVAGAPPNGVAAMAAFDDGRGEALYVAGRFASAGGQPATNIARLRGGAWEPLGAGLTGGEVSDLRVFDEDGPAPAALYAVGKFTHADGVSSPGIARWGNEYCPADHNLDGVTNSQDFFDLLAAFFAGSADFNRDHVTNSQDFFDFLGAFFGGC